MSSKLMFTEGDELDWPKEGKEYKKKLMTVEEFQLSSYLCD